MLYYIKCSYSSCATCASSLSVSSFVSACNITPDCPTQWHRGRDTVQLLQQETPEFNAPDLRPPNSPDLNPVDYRVWGSHAGTSLQDCSVWHSWPQAAPHWDFVQHSKDCHQRSHWRVSYDYEPASKQRDVASSTRCNQPALFRATHILSKKIAMLLYA